MLEPTKLLANADDLGLSFSVNKAILLCFETGYINSTSLLTNTELFEETKDLIHINPTIKNIGVHVNVTEGKPVSNFKHAKYLDGSGNWDKQKTSKKLNFFNKVDAAAFSNEIDAQIEKALSNKILIAHLDSHHHVHTLPCFYKLFLAAAKKYNLKLRLAQTNENGNYLKNSYRKYINQIIKAKKLNYSDAFETVAQFLNHTDDSLKRGVIELMLHPDVDGSGNLTDHYDSETLKEWIKFLGN